MRLIVSKICLVAVASVALLAGCNDVVPVARAADAPSDTERLNVPDDEKAAGSYAPPSKCSIASFGMVYVGYDLQQLCVTVNTTAVPAGIAVRLQDRRAAAHLCGSYASASMNTGCCTASRNCCTAA